MPWNCFNCFRRQSADIKQLNYQHCTLNDVPAEIFAFERTLEELYLDSNRIRDLPRPLFHCHGLKILSLSDNEVHSLPPAVASLINLQHLDVSRNALSNIPDNLKGCKHLTYVDVSVNPLEKLPEGFTQLISLEELYLNDTYLDFLPANFGRLLKLRILELRENNLNTLPKSIARLTHLQRLDIGQNDFSDLPEVIGSLVNLTELWIDSNRIKGLPTFVGNLKKLVHLEASNNNIGWIAPEIEHCTKLTDLTVSCNELHEIPDTVGNLKELITLKLDDNQISVLPNTIGKLHNLEELILSQNDLETLPPCIGLLRKLHILNVDDNMLEELPSEIGSCTSLTILSAHSNKLQQVPAELGHLSNLRVINLSENQLQSLPVSVLNLVQLTALWLSNNQSTPLTTLQQEVEKETGQTVCINFMLPQSSQETHYHDVHHERHGIQPEDQPIKTKPHITFATDSEIEAPSRLMRAPTPYPKELRAMAKHARAIHPRRSSRESDEDIPLLGEMVSQEPKDVLIKEAKVKKPATAPLGEIVKISTEKPLETPESKAEFEGFVDGEKIPGYERIVYPASPKEEGSPVVATDTGPIVREAKCVRKVNAVQNMNVAVLTSLDARQRHSLASNPEPPIQQPPPYHIAAAYSKQAIFFRQADASNCTVPAIKEEKPKLINMNRREGLHLSEASSGENSRKIEGSFFEQEGSDISRMALCSNGISLCMKENNSSDGLLMQNSESMILMQKPQAAEGSAAGSVSSSSPTEESYNAGHDSSLDLTRLGSYREDDSFVEVLQSDLSLTASDSAQNTSDVVESETQERHAMREATDKSEYPSSSGNQVPIHANKIDSETPEQTREVLLLQKPQTFTQDKPVVSEGVVAPTPHRPVSGSPSTPSTPPAESYGYMSLSSPLTPVISSPGPVSTHSSLSPRKSSGIPKSTTPKAFLKISPVLDENVPVKVDHKHDNGPDHKSSYWQTTRILQPGFYSNSSSSYISSRRSSISSSATRPGSIASSCDTPCNLSDTGKNYSNKSVSPTIDCNLNMQLKHTNNAREEGSIENGTHNDNGNKLFKDSTYLSSKIPTLAYSREVPQSKNTKVVPSPQSRIPAPTKLSNSFRNPKLKTTADVQGKHVKTWMFGPHRNATVFPVTIHKNPGLGFSISGGVKSCTAEKYENEIFVTKVHPNGPANGVLSPGDKILEVDGIDFTKLEHDQAVHILKQTASVVNMMISRQQI